MGGEIGFESAPAKGSKFWFTVRLSRGTEESTANAIDAEPLTTELHGGTILVVEDNRINQKVLSHQLINLGYAIDVAENGEEAVAKVKSRRYDLIFMDVQMPVMDGFQATEQIRGLGEDSSSIPIVAVTANAFQSERDKCFSSGMDDYLTKPVDKDRLKEAVRKWARSASGASQQT